MKESPHSGAKVIARVRPSTGLPARTISAGLLTPMRDLVTFATMAPAVVEEINARTSMHALTGAVTVTPFMPIFLPLVQPEVSLRLPPPLVPSRMLFRLDDWPGTFEELIRRWWYLHDHASAALRILLGLSYAPPRWSDSRTVAWAQAFEAYHRIQFKQSAGTKLAKERFDRLLASCPDEDRDWLERRLEHADEPSLVLRIKEMSRRVKGVVDPLLTQHKKFNDRLSKVRNLYAHFGAVDEASGGASGSELQVLAQVAQWIFTANMLLDLGFEESKVKELVQRNDHFRFLVENPSPRALS